MLVVHLQTGEHTNFLQILMKWPSLTGHKPVTHNGRGYTQKLVKWPQKCTAVILSILCYNILVDQQTTTQSDLKSCAALRFFPRYSMPAVKCSNNELESTLLQELVKWCNSVNAQRWVLGSVNHMPASVITSLEKSFCLNRPYHVMWEFEGMNHGETCSVWWTSILFLKGKVL